MLVDALKLDPLKTVNIFNGIEPRGVTERKEERPCGGWGGTKGGSSSALSPSGAAQGTRRPHRGDENPEGRDAGRCSSLVLIEGEGVERQVLEGLVKDGGLDGDVLFVGSEGNVFNFMNAVDVVVLPSIGRRIFRMSSSRR
jgi:hypothetical protein